MLTGINGAIVLQGSEMEAAIGDNSETKITAIKLKNTTASFQQIELLSKGRWDALVELNLFSTKVTPATTLGPKGCKVLSRTAMPLIAWLNLSIKVAIQDCHAITAVGLAHLAKATWNTLRDVDLVRNRLNSAGSYALTKANWKNLSYLNLEYNSLTEQDTKAMILANGKKLRIDVQNNNIDDQSGKLEDAFDQRLYALILYRSFF